MRQFLRLCRAEQYKMKHTILPILHWFIPLIGSAVFLLYYRSTQWESVMQLSGFVQMMGLVFPFLVSLVCSRSITLEESNHMQIFLGGSAGRVPSLLAKCVVLQLAGLAAVIVGIGIFAFGEHVLLGNTDIPNILYIGSVTGLWLGSLVLYPIHLFLCMRFSKSVSMGIGVAQSVLSALLITGLGDGIWQFFPSSWSMRLSTYALSDLLFSEQVLEEGIICLLISVVVCVIISLWFHFRGEMASMSVGDE